MIDLLHDCDPGNDDAVAILAALGDPEINLLAVTTGAGHLSSERTARNAAIAVAAARPATVPVAQGASVPLVRERLIARVLDMANGLDRERPDLPAVALDDLHSVDRIAATVKAHPGLTIVTTGPLTNLGLALRRYPEIGAGIGRIVTLSGAWGLGSKTAAAEWNLLCDPEAAAIVYGAGIPLTMVPIDASGMVPITADLIARVRAAGTPATDLAAELLASLTTTFHPGPLPPQETPLHDPCAILVAAAAGLARSIPARVDIETTPGLNYGRTVVDFALRDGRPANCDVVLSFDVAATHQRLVANLEALGARQMAG